MRLALLTTYTILLATLPAQTVLEPSWMKTEFSNFNTAEGWGIDVDETGNIYWVVSTNNLGQGLDIKAQKFNPEGIALWETPLLYGGAGTQHAYVTNVNDTSLYIGGRYCTGLFNTCDMLVVKVDREIGVATWDRTLNFSGNGYEEVDGLVLADDGIYCGGWAQELQANPFQSDIGLWKLDYAGNTDWVNHFGQANTAEHQDGHFVVDDDHIFAAGLWNGRGLLNLYNGHAFLGKFSKEDGSLVDSILFGAQSETPFDIENALGMASDGEFLYITGYATPSTVTDWQIFVAKYDKSLNQIWYLDWGGTGTETARGIVVENGLVYVAGVSESPEIISGGQRDGILLMLSTEGTVLESYTWGDEQLNNFHDLQVFEDRLYITGTSEADTVTNAKSSFLLAFDDLVTVDVANYEPAVPSLSIYPNPTAERLFIETLDSQVGAVTVFNLLGAQMMKSTLTGSTTQLSVANLIPGVYLVVVEHSHDLRSGIFVKE
ncbi:MAG: T9SS type A sorting domain-containing protein [Bacteroidota bacterium]